MTGYSTCLSCGQRYYAGGGDAQRCGVCRPRALAFVGAHFRAAPRSEARRAGERQTRDGELEGRTI